MVREGVVMAVPQELSVYVGGAMVVLKLVIVFPLL